MNKKNYNKGKSVQVSMLVLNDKSECFFQTDVEENTAILTLNILYQTNYKVTFHLYLLLNFEVIPYSLNGQKENFVNELIITPSDEIQASTGNTICVRGLSKATNDLCFILVSDMDTFTKRFQIKNNNAVVESKYSPIEVTSPKQTFEQSYTVFEDSQNKNVNVIIDLAYVIEGSRYKKQFLEEDSRFNMAVVIFNEGESTFELIGCAAIEEKQFEFNISTQAVRTGDCIRILLFPFANQYNENFISTYKMTLWSSPISIDRIRIGEK